MFSGLISRMTVTYGRRSWEQTHAGLQTVGLFLFFCSHGPPPLIASLFPNQRELLILLRFGFKLIAQQMGRHFTSFDGFHQRPCPLRTFARVFWNYQRAGTVFNGQHFKRVQFCPEFVNSMVFLALLAG